MNAVFDAQVVDSIPPLDLTATGNKAMFYQVPGLVFGEICGINSEGKLDRCWNEAWPMTVAMCINPSSGVYGYSDIFAIHGSFVRNDAWTLEVGNYIFSGDTPGEFTQRKSGFPYQVLGIAVASNVIHFLPNLLLQTYIT